MREMARKRPLRIVTEDGMSLTLKGIRNAAWNQHRGDEKAAAQRSEFARARAERMLEARAALINTDLIARGEENHNDETPE